MESNNFVNKYYKMYIAKDNWAFAMEYENGKCICCQKSPTSNFATIYERETPDLALWDTCKKSDFGKAYAEAVHQNLEFVTSKI